MDNRKEFVLQLLDTGYSTRAWTLPLAGAPLSFCPQNLSGGAHRVPNWSSKLRLESLDGRIVPDASPITNPTPPTGTVGAPTPTEWNATLELQQPHEL